MRDCLSKGDREAGRTEGGRIGEREEIEEAGEEAEAVIKVTGIGEIGKIGEDFVVVEEVVDIEGGGMGTEEVSDVTMNEPQLTEKLGTSQTILKMFLEKTNTFYRFVKCSS